jgi:hypothetical protein
VGTPRFYDFKKEIWKSRLWKRNSNRLKALGISRDMFTGSSIDGAVREARSRVGEV